MVLATSGLEGEQGFFFTISCQPPRSTCYLFLQVDGVGSASLSVIYFFLILSSLFLPSILIDKLTAKWTIVLSMLCYTAYVIAQFYPSYETLMPAAALVGLAAAPLWIAKCAYLTQVNIRATCIRT